MTLRARFADCIALARLLALASAVLVCAASCDRGGRAEEDPETVFELVDDLLDQGDPSTARELLATYGLAETERGLLLGAEASILAGDFDEAISVLTSRVDLTAETVYLLTDACVMGALSAYDEPDAELARVRMQPCARHDRIDARALGMRTAEEAPSDEAVEALIEGIQTTEPSPEVDVAADQLEVGLVERADAVAETDDLEALRLLRHAFAVAHEPEIGTRVCADHFTAAEERFDSDSQTAATLYEHVYLPRLEGLACDSELVERATSRAQEALLPVFVGNLRPRYERKFGDEDERDGRYDPASGTFDVGPLADADDYEAFLVWLYHRFERPRPRPTPDVLTWAGVCEDRAAPCRFTFETFARISYFNRAIEREYLEAHPGVEFDWTSP